MALLPCQSPFSLSKSQLQIQIRTHKLKLSSSIIPNYYNLSQTTIQFPIRDNKALISIIPINPRFPSLPSLHCSSSSNSSVSASESDNDSSSPSIFIKGLSKSTTEGRLKKMFSEFGLVKQVKILTDEASGESLGLAYVWFVNENYTELAVKQMNGKFFDGRFICVSIPKGSSKGKGQRKVRQYRF